MTNVTFKIQGVQQVKEGKYLQDTNTLEFSGLKKQPDDILLDVPIHGTVYGTVLNYKGEYEQLKSSMNEDPYNSPPKAPILYIKPVNTHNANGSTIPIPEGIDEVTAGAALGVVIGKTAKQVSKEHALDHVAGYTVVNDISIPHENVYRPAYKDKARDGFCPIGPWVVDSKHIDNPNNLGIQVYVNGELKQENTTENLIRSVEQLIEEVTEFMTLYEGDVLLVGVPENKPLLSENDHVQVEIQGVGSLSNKVVKEDAVVGGGIS